jgi:uncharacterized protein (TIRG00374 family)
MAIKMKKDFKFWLNVFTIVALVFLIIITWDQIVEAFNQIDGLKTWALLSMIPIQALSYYAVAKLYKNFFTAQGHPVGLKDMYKIALELNFVNHVFPSGGVSGFSYLSVRLKQHGVPTAKSTLAQILRFALTFISFLVLLVFALIALSFSDSVGGLALVISSVIIITTIFASLGGAFIISKPSRIKAFVSWLPKAINYIARIFGRNKTNSLINIEKVEDTMEDLHEDYVVLSKDMNLVKNLLKWSLVINITEVLTIYMVYVSFSQLINPGSLIIAYAVANFAGLIAILPGGVGVYEGLMTATLASTGVPKALALSATVIYRVLSMVFFLPIGYFFYLRAIKEGGKITSQKVDSKNDSDS